MYRCWKDVDQKVVSTIIQAVCYSLILLSALYLSYNSLLDFLHHKEMLRINYQGQTIPVSVGIVIPLLHLWALPWILDQDCQFVFVLQSGALLIIAFVGWKDDKLGGIEAKGLKGHIMYSIRTRQLTTGIWKAITVCSVSLVVSLIFSSTFFSFVVHFLLMSLLTNTINLLDLRPGRAIKGFFLILTAILFLIGGSVPSPLVLTVMIPSLYLFLYDIQGKVMLGDTGANCLGFVLGFWSVLYAPMGFNLVILVIVASLQMYAEKKSLSHLIQQTRVLQWFDQLGREREKLEEEGNAF